MGALITWSVIGAAMGVLSKPTTSVVLDVRNPLGIRSALRRSLADAA